MEKPSAIRLSKYVKIKALSPLPFPEKSTITFAIFGLFLPGNRVESKIKGLESKCKFVKTCWFQHFPVLQLYKGHFRKILTGFSNLVAFLMQYLMLNRLTPISNPKNEKAKSSYGRACRAGVCVCVFYHKKWNADSINIQSRRNQTFTGEDGF